MCFLPDLVISHLYLWPTCAMKYERYRHARETLKQHGNSDKAADYGSSYASMRSQMKHDKLTEMQRGLESHQFGSMGTCLA